jgi:glucose/arabinose dehydrogenase
MKHPLTPSATRRDVLALGLGLGFGPAFAQAGGEPLRTRLVAKGLELPWAMAFLPDFERDGRMLVTEKTGRVRIVDREGRLSAPLRGVPTVDVALHPGFASNRWVYLSYSEPAASGQGGNSTAVARGRLDRDALELKDVKVVFRQAPKVESSAHFGSRLVFARDGTLFVTLGDRYSRKDDAQTLDTHHGKVVRITDDGGVPADNPYAQKSGALPEIWSYGHRNVQGAALHPTTGELWTHEHGPQGGDEVNIAQAGRNYGWPVVTRGRNYVIGTKIGEAETRGDVEPALTTWVPSIAPCGMAFVTGDRYPAWKGQLLVGALKAQLLVRLELDGNRVLREHRHPVGARVRDVRQAPDGHIYLLTDEDDGRVLRIEA